MFMNDSSSDEEGILSRAHANIRLAAAHAAADERKKGIDPDASFASETGNDSVSLTQDSTTLDSALVETSSYLDSSDRLTEWAEVIEVETAPVRRSPRINKSAPLNVSIDNDVDLITSRRRRSARRVIHPESSNSNVTTHKRKPRTRLGSKSNADVICIGSDDDENYVSQAIPSKRKAKAKAGSKPTKNNAEQIESISLGSDDEASSKDEAYLNEKINVKILWMCEGGLIIRHGRNQPFAKIYEELSRTKGYDVNKIFLCKKDGKFIKPHETPLSIKLSIIDILDGSVSSKAIEYENENSNPEADSENSNLLNFKILVEGQKAPSYMKIEKDQTMHVLLTKLAGKLNYSVDKMRLWFDGEPVRLQDTPLTMDLEGDECLELKLKKT